LLTLKPLVSVETIGSRKRKTVEDAAGTGGRDQETAGNVSLRSLESLPRLMQDWVTNVTFFALTKAPRLM